MRIETSQIVRQQEQSEFVCSSCGADRGCDCNAPALKRLADMFAGRPALIVSEKTRHMTRPLKTLKNLILRKFPQLRRSM
jgi:hypothetical protein